MIIIRVDSCNIYVIPSELLKEQNNAIKKVRPSLLGVLYDVCTAVAADSDKDQVAKP